MLRCVDPEFEWRAAADGQLYRGHDGVREFFAKHNGGERLEVPLQRAVELRPGCVLGVGRVRVLRPGRGLSDSPGIWLFHVTDGGRVRRIESYRSEREALEAAQAAEATLSARL
jgi:hypothetical protein